MFALLVFVGCLEPRPHPSTCLDTGSATTNLEPLVVSNEPFSPKSEAGAEYVDGGVFSLHFSGYGGLLVTFPEVTATANVARSEVQNQRVFRFQPVDVALPVEVRFIALCIETPAPALRVVMTPNDGGYDAAAFDVP